MNTDRNSRSVGDGLAAMFGNLRRANASTVARPGV